VKLREHWLDVAKGLTIITVLFAHGPGFPGYEEIKRYMLWFNMPLFFAVAGYLFKPVASWSDFRRWTLRRTRQLMLPYISFLVLIALLQYVFWEHSAHGPAVILHTLAKAAPGGQHAEGNFNAFWFITCLFVAQIAFAALRLWLRPVRLQLLALGIAYLLAHVEAAWARQHSIMVPLNADVALLSLTYYALGFYARSLWPVDLRKGMSLAAALLFAATWLVFADRAGLFTYLLDMKYLKYYSPLLDLVVPAVASASVCLAAVALTRMPLAGLFAALGRRSMPIMYLHIIANDVATHVLRSVAQVDGYNMAIFIAIGLAVPILVSWLVLERFPVTHVLFVGRPRARVVAM